MKNQSSTSRIALDKAIDVLGSQTALAAVCGKAQGHVSHWLKAGRVPVEFCPLIEKATDKKGCKVSCEELRGEVDWAYLRGTAAEPIGIAESDPNTAQTPAHQAQTATETVAQGVGHA